MDIALVIGALAACALISVMAGTNVPTNALWRILRDALYAFITWLILSGVAIYELGQIGFALAELLGILFLICFAALRFKEIVGYVATRGDRRRYREPPPPPAAPPGPPPPPREPNYCPKCGTAWAAGARICANSACGQTL